MYGKRLGFAGMFLKEAKDGPEEVYKKIKNHFEGEGKHYGYKIDALSKAIGNRDTHTIMAALQRLRDDGIVRKVNGNWEANI